MRNYEIELKKLKKEVAEICNDINFFEGYPPVFAFCRLAQFIEEYYEHFDLSLIFDNKFKDNLIKKCESFYKEKFDFINNKSKSKSEKNSFVKVNTHLMLNYFDLFIEEYDFYKCYN